MATLCSNGASQPVAVRGDAAQLAAEAMQTKEHVEIGSQAPDPSVNIPACTPTGSCCESLDSAAHICSSGTDLDSCCCLGESSDLQRRFLARCLGLRQSENMWQKKAKKKNTPGPDARPRHTALKQGPDARPRLEP